MMDCSLNFRSLAEIFYNTKLEPLENNITTYRGVHVRVFANITYVTCNYTVNMRMIETISYLALQRKAGS